MCKHRNDLKLSHFFKLKEFECNGFDKGKCACGGSVILNDLFFKRINYFRGYINRQIYLTRGYSCHEYNKILNGHPKSKHLEGKAADWDVLKIGLTEIEGALLASESGLFTGIGIYGKSYRDKNTGTIKEISGFGGHVGMVHLEYCIDEDSRAGKNHGIIGPTNLFRKWGDWPSNT
jgi:hypothetical protein